MVATRGAFAIMACSRGRHEAFGIGRAAHARSEAVALGTFSNEDKQILGAAETSAIHAPAKLKRKPSQLQNDGWPFPSASTPGTATAPWSPFSQVLFWRSNPRGSPASASTTNGPFITTAKFRLFPAAIVVAAITILTMMAWHFLFGRENFDAEWNG
ncbi:MAG: hypothetical protein KA098_04700 [Phenylobacterium sp.]|nr:hypothetical protein [Phenylobacterium sp.]